jgi:CBS domain-containing protein
MDIRNSVSTSYEAFDADQRVSKLVGAFEDSSLKGVIVTNDGAYKGVVTRRQLASSQHQPDQKVGSLVWHVPRVARTEDVREVAQLMIDSDSRILPVFEGDTLEGVVTADAILEEVQPFLDEATVAHAYTDDIETVGSEETFGEAIHTFREHRITHLPVVEDESAVGILSLSDVVDLTVRSVERSQGGNTDGFDEHGGRGSRGNANSTGGHGAREGESDRLLDLPVRDVMTSPVRTISPDQTLEAAVGEMFDVGGSSLSVVDDADRPVGIVTKTDVLESLTWGAEGSRAVQVYGMEYLDDMSYQDFVDVVDKFDDMGGEMSVLDAKVHLHEHDETLRGTPLLLARIRLYTDQGLFIASGEGYGASHAINEARDVLERRIRDQKTYGKSKKHPDEDYWEKRFGWILAE